MNSFKFRALVGLFFFLFSLNLLGYNSESFGQSLINAEKIKSSDPVEFDALMIELERNFDDMEIDQKYFFLFLKGYHHAYNGRVDKAVLNYKHVLENSRITELQYKSASSLVNLFAFTKEWEKGFAYLDVIENLKSQIPNSRVRNHGIITASIFYNEIEYFSSTINNLEGLLRERPDSRTECSAKGLLLNAKLLSGGFIESKEEFERSLELCESSGETMMAHVIRTYQGWYLLDKKKYQEALNLMDTNLDKIESSNYQLIITDSYAILASAYLATKDYQSANRFALKAVENFEEAAKIEPIVKAFKILYDLSVEEKDYLKAIRYLELYMEAERRRYSDLNARQLAIESAKRSASEKDNQISLLNKQNEILKLEKELSEETALYNRWIIGLLAILVTILIAWTVNVRRSQQKLKYLAEYDSLTGVSNRAHFTRSSEDLLNVLKKSNRAASLVLFDLDNFKRVNDNYGHPVGDEVLKLAAGVCRDSVRRVDIFGRVGGEEFAILLPGCDLDQALKIAEDCRVKMSEIDTSETGHKFEVSGSFGIAHTESSGYLLKDLMAHADEAMYLAKRRGRNQVVIQPSE